MSKRQNLLAVWQQIPVANRTVEVNTKTGFSLTPGSYAVLASATQSGTIAMATAASNTAAISSVTTTRAIVGFMGFKTDGASFAVAMSRLALTNATTITADHDTGTNNVTIGWSVQELF